MNPQQRGGGDEFSFNRSRGIRMRRLASVGLCRGLNSVAPIILPIPTTTPEVDPLPDPPIIISSPRESRNGINDPSPSVPDPQIHSGSPGNPNKPLQGGGEETVHSIIPRRKIKKSTAKKGWQFSLTRRSPTPDSSTEEEEDEFEAEAPQRDQDDPLGQPGSIIVDRENNQVRQPLLEYYTPNPGALLGRGEMEKYLKGRSLVIQVTTWNMGSQPLPREYQLRKLFYHHEDDSLKRVDMHVVCTQECWPEKEAWELDLSDCLGPGFALFHSVSFGTIQLCIFLRRDLVWFTTEPANITLSVRNGRLFKTKGSAGVAFGIFGSKFLFITAHLSAGEGDDRVKQRVEELGKIIIGTEKVHTSCGGGGGPNRYDAVFLCGDLNFRIWNMKREHIIEAIKMSDLKLLLEKDQLNRVFHRRDILPHFLEGFYEAAGITFNPTYKYDLGSDSFDSSNKKRAPAYTDRILYKNRLMPNNDPSVVCLAYEAVSNLHVSDHKPVFAVFSVSVKAGTDALPITGGLFKREVYVKAVRRRAQFLLANNKTNISDKKKPGIPTSSVCSIT